MPTIFTAFTIAFSSGAFGFFVGQILFDSLDEDSPMRDVAFWIIIGSFAFMVLSVVTAFLARIVMY